MLFRMSGRGRAAAPAGRPRRRRRMAVARLGDAGDAAPRRGNRLSSALGRIVLPRLRLRALLLRSRRALARLRGYYADVMKRLVADAAAAEPAKARRAVEDRAGAGETVVLVHAGRPAVAVVPAAVAGAVLRCNSHYYIR